MKKTLLITALAHNTIVSVSRRCLVETGGVLVGILGNPLVIVAAGQPGANAIHHSIRFTTDPTADMECLSTWRRVYGLVIEVLGWYHKHHYLQEPSGGDRHQVRQLREDFKDNRPIIMGIVSESGLFRKELKLRFFGLDTNGDQIEYDWQIIPNDSPEIEKAIQSVPPKPDIKDTNFWNDPEFQFYKNQVGRERICRDIQQLKRYGWNTLVCRSKTNESMILQVTNNHGNLQLFIPPEYPLNPPTVSACDNKRMVKLKTLSEWNSMMTLMDVITEADQIQNCPICRSRHLIAQ
jgi:hypothetical protein